MRTRLFSVLVPVVLWAAAPLAWAGIIYDSGAPITDSTLACQPVCQGVPTSIGEGVLTLQTDATITGVQFWTFQFAGSYQGGTLDWHIYQDNGGSQGSLIGSGTFVLSETLIGDVNVDGADLVEYENDFTISSLFMDPASPQTYFLDLSDSSGIDHTGTYWATSGYGIQAFQIDGTPDPAPEPSTFLLLAGGVAVLFGRRAWLRSKSTTRTQH